MTNSSTKGAANNKKRNHIIPLGPEEDRSLTKGLRGGVNPCFINKTITAARPAPAAVRASAVSNFGLSKAKNDLTCSTVPGRANRRVMITANNPPVAFSTTEVIGWSVDGRLIIKRQNITTMIANTTCIAIRLAKQIHAFPARQFFGTVVTSNSFKGFAETASSV